MFEPFDTHKMSEVIDDTASENQRKRLSKHLEKFTVVFLWFLREEVAT